MQPTESTNQAKREPFSIGYPGSSSSSFSSTESARKINVLLQGEIEVGKSALIYRYMHQEFIEGRINNERFDGTVPLADRVIDIKLVEFPLNARFHNCPNASYRRANVALLVADITGRSSAEDLAGYVREIKRYGKNNLPIILVSNKCDLDGDERVVSRAAMEEIVHEHSLAGHVEVSAKTGVNVNELFEKAAILGEEFLLSQTQPTPSAPQQEAIVPKPEKSICTIQ